MHTRYILYCMNANTGKQDENKTEWSIEATVDGWCYWGTSVFFIAGWWWHTEVSSLPSIASTQFTVCVWSKWRNQTTDWYGTTIRSCYYGDRNNTTIRNNSREYYSAACVILQYKEKKVCMLGWNIILFVIQITDVVIRRNNVLEGHEQQKKLIDPTIPDINVLITICNLERITTFVMILVSVLLEIAMICITTNTMGKQLIHT